MLLSFISSYAQQSNNNQYVNPFVGTDFHGHTFPGATYPFGMVQLSPDTRLTGWDGCSGYHYSDSTIYGFSHTHLSGTGIPDYCDILVMPVSGYNHPDIDREHYKSQFSHKREKASPGYYEVFLDKPEVLVQLTTGKRVGMHRYSYRKDAEKQIIIDLSHRDEVLDSGIEIVDNHTIKGFRRSKSWAQNQIVYFYMEFSEPFQKPDIFNNIKTLLTFTGENGNILLVRTGISSVSEENAKLNLLAEVKGWDFNKLRSETENAWNEYLGKIDVETLNTVDKRIFYTALYHTAMAPNLYSDVNGEYRGMDRRVHKADGYEQYTVFSLWDTYRALHPLFTIIEQRRTTDFVKSFLAIYKQAGKLPIWELSGNETNCMIGYHSIPVIADAIKKNISGFDVSEALNAMVNSSNRNEYGIDIYIKNGFIPAQMEHESVSKTLEYAYDDWCIAQVAKQLGNVGLYEKYMQRAQYYKNVFDPATGFMRPKIKGKWLTPFNPTEVNFHFVEANSWQYSFYVPQDINTHIKMLGGDDSYTSKLDELFSASTQTTGRTQSDITGLIGQYAHGNEPSHHTAYLYSYAGKPWKTQEMVRKIMGTLYSAAPDGLCGNDDCGQMSAWYVLSAIGFYPVTPGDETYVLGSPLFSNVIINLENGEKFTIKSPSSNNKNIYIKSALLNGKDYTKSYITHSDIIAGSTIDLRMAPTPDFSFGTSQSDRPHSLIEEYTIVTNPWYEMDSNIFKDSIKVGIKTGSTDYTVWYRTEGSRNNDFQKYTSPLTISESSTLSAYSQNMRGEKSFVVTATLSKINRERKIRILSKYNPQYSAGGDEGLLDGVRGELNFRLGGWQGYQYTDFEAIVDLGSEKEISSLGAGFLQDARSWIWMPQYVEFAVSSDGLNYVSACRVDNNVDNKELAPEISNLVKKGLSLKARYVKVLAKNLGIIPEWHESAGEKAFIFIDEIIID
jgi:predicted alpha-1,2-mannosidase